MGKGKRKVGTVFYALYQIFPHPKLVAITWHEKSRKEKTANIWLKYNLQKEEFENTP